MNLHVKSMLSVCFLCMLLLVCSSFVAARERVALVIGNAAYPSEALTNPVNDAKAVAKVLKQLHFDVMLVTDANQAKMQDAVESFGEKLRKDKEAVFYYSGHGVQDKGENYLIPVDAISRILVPKHLPQFCITLDYVVQLMVGKGSDMNIVMVDACRNNPFKSIFKDIGTEKGLASLYRKADGMLISYATAPGEKALNGTGGNSPYTRRLVELMMTPDISVERMFKELRSKVKLDTEGEQVPWMAASLGGEFYFNPVQVNDDQAVPSIKSGGASDNNARPAVSTSAVSAAVAGVPGMLDGRFVLIRGGEFTMVSPADEANHQSDETQYQVKVSDFYMSKYELTVGEFRKFVEASGYRTDAEKGDGSYLWDGKEWKKRAGINWRYGVSGSVRLPSEDSHPVVHVSWNDAVAYCKWISETTGKTYRLPTEAEWEYACRAGNPKPFNTGENLTTDQANYDGNYPFNGNAKGVYRQTTLPVDSFAPNALGLYNMHGNVWEWCSDWYGTYPSVRVENPVGPSSGSYRVLRGGGWRSYAGDCRSASRGGSTPDSRGGTAGFRLVFVP